MSNSDRLRKLVEGKRVALIGIGVSNTPLAYMLCDLGATVSVHDLKSREKLGEIATELEKKGIALHLGEGYLDCIDADVIFKSPGIRSDIPGIVSAVENGAYLTSEMQMFFELCPSKIIAVTGSDGKTTTTTLIAKILEKAGKKVYLGGNIGTPLLPVIDSIGEEDFSVVELSSFQLPQMTRSPDVAVVTNLTPNHLDWHTDMNEYISSKFNILKYQSEGCVAVLNYEDPTTREFGALAKGNVMFFSSKSVLESGVCERDGAIYCRGERIIEVKDIVLPGRHNVENYMAAIGATFPYVSSTDVKRVASTFGGVEHRCELVRELDGVRYYNSSIDSSPTRTIAALNAFDQKVIILCGGYDKNLDYTPLAEPLSKKAKAVIMTGATKDKIKNALLARKDEGKEIPPMYECDSYEDAVRLARRIAVKGDVVLLSPASASFDCFTDFMERGRLFKKWVNELD